jgi:hypothetical protein
MIHSKYAHTPRKHFLRVTHFLRQTSLIHWHMETAALQEEATIMRINVHERVSALSLAPFDRFTDYRRTLRDIVVGGGE